MSVAFVKQSVLVAGMVAFGIAGTAVAGDLRSMLRLNDLDLDRVTAGASAGVAGAADAVGFGPDGSTADTSIALSASSGGRVAISRGRADAAASGRGPGGDALTAANIVPLAGVSQVVVRNFSGGVPGVYRYSRSIAVGVGLSVDP